MMILLAYLESHCAIQPAGRRGTSELSGPLSGLAGPGITLTTLYAFVVGSRYPDEGECEVGKDENEMFLRQSSNPERVL